jgi:hypothetical protein
MSQSDQGPNSGNPDPQNNKDKENNNLITGQVKHPQLSARVPEHVSRGVFSTGVIVMTGQTEFVLDFVLRMAHPQQIVARVVLPLAVIPQVIAAVRDNIGKYQARFGEIPSQPNPQPPAGQPRPSIQEIYDDLRLPDELLSGTYANAVMVGHSTAEFYFDFITTFFPKSSVSSRIFMSSAQVPRLLDALTQTYDDYARKLAAAQAQQRQIMMQQPQSSLGLQTPAQPLRAPEAAPATPAQPPSENAPPAPTNQAPEAQPPAPQANPPAPETPGNPGNSEGTGGNQ